MASDGHPLGCVAVAAAAFLLATSSSSSLPGAHAATHPSFEDVCLGVKRPVHCGFACECTHLGWNCDACWFATHAYNKPFVGAYSHYTVPFTPPPVQTSYPYSHVSQSHHTVLGSPFDQTPYYPPRLSYSLSLPGYPMRPTFHLPISVHHVDSKESTDKEANTESKKEEEVTQLVTEPDDPEAAVETPENPGEPSDEGTQEGLARAATTDDLSKNYLTYLILESQHGHLKPHKAKQPSAEKKTSESLPQIYSGKSVVNEIQIRRKILGGKLLEKLKKLKDSVLHSGEGEGKYVNYIYYRPNLCESQKEEAKSEEDTPKDVPGEEDSTEAVPATEAPDTKDLPKEGSPRSLNPFGQSSYSPSYFHSLHHPLGSQPLPAFLPVPSAPHPYMYGVPTPVLVPSIKGSGVVVAHPPAWNVPAPGGWFAPHPYHIPVIQAPGKESDVETPAEGGGGGGQDKEETQARFRRYAPVGKTKRRAKLQPGKP